MRRIVCCMAIILTFAENIIAQKPEAEIKLAKFKSYVNELKSKDENLRHAIWSVAVADVETGKFLYEYNSDLSMLPASNMKLITTGVGLIMLGEDYRFKTKLEYSGNIKDSTLYGNLIIIGGGDPTIGSDFYFDTKSDMIFEQWLYAVKQVGISKIEGEIVADTRFFDDENKHGSWDFNDLATDYGAGVSGIQFCDNKCTLYLETAENISQKPSILSVEPYVPNILWKNDLTSVENKDNAEWDIYGSPYSDKVVLTGTMPTNSGVKKIAAAIPNTAYVCAWYFNRFLNQNNVKTMDKIKIVNRNTVIADTLPRKHFYTYESPQLTEIVLETNKNSNNSFAETILKTISAEFGTKGSTKEGRNLVESKITDLGVKTGGFKQSDGSGLSRQNYITTKFMCNFLVMMSKQNEYESFRYSLPIAGKDGTLKHLLTNTVAENNVRAKSGSLSGVKTYSGYITTKSGKELCFSFFTNNTTCKSILITRKLEKLMLTLAQTE